MSDEQPNPDQDRQQPARQQQQQPQQQPQSQQPLRSSTQWIPPTTGNPDLDPAGQQTQRIDLREIDPLVPQGMLYDPRHLLDQRRQRQSDLRPDCGLPPGARFDPFGPPDPGQVGPGRGPLPSSQFGVPDPDHLPPPGQPQPPNLGTGKSLKFAWPPGKGFGGGGHLPPPGGAGGSPFL